MIIFVRHGETEGNAKRLFIGDINFPLTEDGLNQAKSVAKQLKDTKIDVIFCSPLLRARQTMHEIAKFHKKTPLYFDERLIERSDGSLSGQEIGDIDAKRWTFDEHRPEWGESIMEAYARVRDFYEYVLKKYKGKTVLVVSHGGIGKLSRCYFDGFPKDENFMGIKVDNAKPIILKK